MIRQLYHPYFKNMTRVFVQMYCFFLQQHLELLSWSNRFSKPNRWDIIDITHSWRRIHRTTCKFVRQSVLCSWNMSDPEVREEIFTAADFFHVCKESWPLFRCRHHLHHLRTISRKNYIKKLQGLHALYCPN